MHNRRDLLALIERAARGDAPPEPESLDLDFVEPTPPRRSFSEPLRAPVLDSPIPRLNRLARGDSLSGRGSSVRFEMPFDRLAEESACPACGQPVTRHLPSHNVSEEPSEQDVATPIVGVAGDTRVVVFGSINMDMTARAHCWWPEAPHSTHMGELQQSPGGKGANEAVALARLGVSTSLVGRLGNDEHARFLLEHFAQECVDTSGIQQQPDGFTGTAIQIVTSKVHTSSSHPPLHRCAGHSLWRGRPRAAPPGEQRDGVRRAAERQRAAVRARRRLRRAAVRAGDLPLFTC